MEIHDERNRVAVISRLFPETETRNTLFIRFFFVDLKANSIEMASAKYRF